MRGDPFERMFSTVKELLWRQRQIQPFPCNKDDVLLSLLPPEMQDWAVIPVKNNDISVEWMNLSNCISTGMSVVIEFDSETGKAFWMRFDSRVPVPINSNAYNMPPENLHYGILSRWYKRANVIHEELKMYQQALWDFLQRANHPLLVEKYWKELHPFVDFDMHPGGLMKSPDLNKRRLMPVPPRRRSEWHC